MPQSPAPPPERSAQEIRRRLVEIDDRVRALPDDAFAEKHALHTEGDALRSRLGDLLAEELDEAGREWAERSSRKASHTADDDLERAKAAIPSPLHSN